MNLCDERETWLTKAENLINDLTESLRKRGYSVRVNKLSEREYRLTIARGDVERASIAVVKEARQLAHLSPLDRYIEPYVLKIKVEADPKDGLCSLIKLLLMKGGG